MASENKVPDNDTRRIENLLNAAAKDCPSKEELLDYIAGKTDEVDTAWIRGHIRVDCAGCAERYARLLTGLSDV